MYKIFGQFESTSSNHISVALLAFKKMNFFNSSHYWKNSENKGMLKNDNLFLTDQLTIKY